MPSLRFRQTAGTSKISTIHAGRIGKSISRWGGFSITSIDSTQNFSASHRGRRLHDPARLLLQRRSAGDGGLRSRAECGGSVCGDLHQRLRAARLSPTITGRWSVERHWRCREHCRESFPIASICTVRALPWTPHVRRRWSLFTWPARLAARGMSGRAGRRRQCPAPLPLCRFSRSGCFHPMAVARLRRANGFVRAEGVGVVRLPLSAAWRWQPDLRGDSRHRDQSGWSDEWHLAAQRCGSRGGGTGGVPPSRSGTRRGAICRSAWNGHSGWRSHRICGARSHRGNGSKRTNLVCDRLGENQYRSSRSGRWNRWNHQDRAFALPRSDPAQPALPDAKSSARFREMESPPRARIGALPLRRKAGAGGGEFLRLRRGQRACDPRGTVPSAISRKRPCALRSSADVFGQK